MVRRVAAADMGVAVGLLVSPLRSVEIMIVIGSPVRDPGKGIIAHVKQLAAEIALLISVPALLGAVRFLLREEGEGVVTTVYRHLAGGRFCSCRCGNDRFTGGYGGHLARGGIDGSNSGLVRRPYHRVGRIGRRDRRFQAVIHCTDCQRQLALVKRDTGCRLRGGRDSDGRRDACGIFGFVVLSRTAVRFKFKQSYLIISRSSIVIHCALKCHYCDLICPGEILCAKCTQELIGILGPGNFVPAKFLLDTLRKSTAIHNVC